MTTFTPTYSVTKLFLDRAEIQNRIGQARARALSRQGAFVRTTARQKILRRRKRVSAPGKPPSIHSRDPNRSLKRILFFYDSRSDSVVIGPVKMNQVNFGTSGQITIPQLLEFGGTARIREVQYPNSFRWFRRDGRRRTRPGYRYRTRTARYAPRPFMSVALDREIQAGTITESWRNVVRS